MTAASKIHGAKYRTRAGARRARHPIPAAPPAKSTKAGEPLGRWQLAA
jgi:hypothetical protein